MTPPKLYPKTGAVTNYSIKENTKKTFQMHLAFRTGMSRLRSIQRPSKPATVITGKLMWPESTRIMWPVTANPLIPLPLDRGIRSWGISNLGHLFAHVKKDC